MSSSGYLAIEIMPGMDVSFIVLNKEQMDRVNELYSGGLRFEEAMMEVMEEFNLYEGQSFSTVMDALAYIHSENLDLVEDFTFISC